ncbi:portal protein, partial [bacterium]|nr:portal protein [bacterium]
MELFGFEINRKKEPKAAQSFVAPDSDGALEAIRGGGYYGTYFDVEGVANTEEQLVKRYRDISMYADVDTAIEDIVNDSISNLDDEKPVEVNTDDIKVSATVKKAIADEFVNVLSLLDFNNRAQDYYRRWYIDGRIYFHKVVDKANPKKGLHDVR